MNSKMRKVTKFTYIQVITSKWFCIITILGILGTMLATQYDKIAGWISGGQKAEVTVQAGETTGQTTAVAVEASARSATQIAGVNTDFLIPFLIVLALFLLILIYGSNIANSIVEEKSARIVETLLCYVKPVELLSGKIFGYVAGIVTQLAIWIGYYALMMHLVDMPGSGLQISSLVNTQTLILMVGSIVLGFVMYAFAFAALAAFADNAQDSTQLMMPVGVVIMGVYFVSLAVLNGARGMVITILSYAPFCLPIMAFATNNLHTLTWQQLFINLGTQLAEVIVIIVVCSKIYRRGVVNYGMRKPTIRWNMFGSKSGSRCRSK